jgi:hypothetical protein
MAYRDTSGVGACYHVITMLEAQLRSAHKLLQHLEGQGAPPDHRTHVVNGLCSSLLDDAVATAQAVAMLKDTLCGQSRYSAGFVDALKPDTRR